MYLSFQFLKITEEYTQWHNRLVVAQYRFNCNRMIDVGKWHAECYKIIERRKFDSGISKSEFVELPLRSDNGSGVL